MRFGWFAFAISLAIARGGAAAQQPSVAISIPPEDVWWQSWFQDMKFRSSILEASRLKQQGQQLKAFRILYDQVGPIEDEERIFSALGGTECPDGLTQRCVLSTYEVSVPEAPAPATLEELPYAHRQLFSDSSSHRPVRFGWELVTAAAREGVETWRIQAANGAPFRCDDDICLQLFGINHDRRAGAGEGEETAPGGQDQSRVTIAEGIAARPLLALCEVAKVGAVFGPPERCIAVLAEAQDALFALSVTARDRRPPAPPPAPAPLPPPPVPPPVILRVGVSGVANSWLAKEVERALARPALKLAAVAKSPYRVDALTGFRNSPVLPPYREMAKFLLRLTPTEMGWMISLSSHLRVTRQASSSDLRQAREDEISQYQMRIRNAIAAWLRTACAPLPGKCDLSD